MIEGGILVADALASGVNVEAVFAEPRAGAAVLETARTAGVEVHRLADGVLDKVLTTVTPPPVVAVAEWCDTPEAHTDFTVVLAGVSDPGNAGTLVRSAEAAGAGAVRFLDGAVDPFNPKCVRASAGSIFHLPLVIGGEPVGVMARMGAEGYRRVAAVPRGGVAYDELDLTGPVAVVLGNEAHGLPAGAEAEVDDWACIPMAGRVESLNVAMAGSVLCFEVARQRRNRRSRADGASASSPGGDGSGAQPQGGAARST